MRPSGFRFGPALLLLLLLLAACKKEPVCTVDDVFEFPHQEQRAVEKDVAAVAAGRALCPGLYPLRIELTGADLAFRGAQKPAVMPRSAIPASSLTRIEPLTDRLAHYRERWQLAHPQGPSLPTVEVALDPELEAERARSVLMTLSRFGDLPLRVTAGDATFSGVMWGIPPVDAFAYVDSLVVEQKPGGYALRFDTSAACRPGATEKIVPSLAAIPGAIEAMCAGEALCADQLVFLVPEAKTAKELVTVASAALASAAWKTAPQIVFARRIDETWPGMPAELVGAKRWGCRPKGAPSHPVGGY